MNNEKFIAECPKCGMTYKGNAKYFRFDLKEKCFDGITKLVNYRIAGTKFDANAYKLAGEMIANAQSSLNSKRNGN
jgi:protein-arginine kinase activator protein McsA